MWKHILAAILAPITSTLGVWAANTMAGQHIPFTVGTILAPALPIYLGYLYHLLQVPPSMQPPTQ